MILWSLQTQQPRDPITPQSWTTHIVGSLSVWLRHYDLNEDTDRTTFSCKNECRALNQWKKHLRSIKSASERREGQGDVMSGSNFSSSWRWPFKDHHLFIFFLLIGSWRPMELPVTSLSFLTDVSQERRHLHSSRYRAECENLPLLMNLYGLFYWPLKMINGASSHFETQGQLNPNKWHLQTVGWKKNKKKNKKLEAMGRVFAQLIVLHHNKTAASQVVVLVMCTFVAGGAPRSS